MGTRKPKHEKVDLNKADDPTARALAQNALRPSVNAAVTVRSIVSTYGELPLPELIGELVAQATSVRDGNLARGEATLVAHAHTLDAVFNQLTQRAMLNVGHYPETVERYMRLALKAQAQCRATIQALNDLKNPRPVAFVQQANIGQAVQVNNGQPVGPEVLGKSQIGLLEAKGAGEWVVGGTAQETGRGDPAMAAMDAIDGTDDRTGKG